MKNIIMGLFLIVGLNAFAQNTDRRFLVLHESKVKDMDVFRNDMAIFNPFYKEKHKDIISGRGVHSSETGTIYSITNIKGTENFGKLITKRYDDNPSEKFKEINPKIAQEMSANWDGSARRSSWIRINSLVYLPEDYKPENYKFRKIIIRTVPADQQDEYEKKLAEKHELESKLGINYLSITWKAVEGYPGNTYITLAPDNSIVDFYTHNVDRNQKRNNSKEYIEFRKTIPKSNVIRIDHLFHEF